MLFNKNKTTLIQYPGGKSGKYIIPNSVKNIDMYAFRYCDKLTSVTIPGSVIKFEWTFMSCTRLKSVVIKDGVKSIGNNAFSDCTKLYNVIIPNSVTQIDKGAFDGCNKLTIFGKKDSYAKKYAKKNKLYFVVK